MLGFRAPLIDAAVENDTDLQPRKLEGTMASVLELRYIIGPTKFAMECPQLSKVTPKPGKG